MTQYIHKKGIVYKNQFHIIFTPKYRRKVLIGDIEARLRELFIQIATENDIDLKSFEIMPDHVHLFVEFDPRMSTHIVVKKFKGITSRILRDEFPSLKSRLPSLWTRSYFCCSVGHINEAAIKKYIESQKNK